MNRVSGVYIALVILAVAFLSFVGGAAAHHRRLLPYDLLGQAFMAARAYKTWYWDRPESYSLNQWSTVRHAGKGVTRYEKGKAYEGLTLFTSGHAQKAFLIDMEGRLVHEWNLPFRNVWPNPPHVPWPVTAHRTYYERARVQPNGDLLAVIQGSGDTPYGYGLIKLDKNSKLIWSYPQRVHHDVDVGPDGRVYTLLHHIRTDAVPAVPRVLPPFIDDSIAILSPEGRELRRINILRAFMGSQYETALGLIRIYDDPLHTNTIKVVDERIASRHPYVRVGQILISTRNIDIIAVVDPDSESVVWALRGSWVAQHDPDFLDNGRLLLFDNLGHWGQRPSSRVIEIDPQTQGIHWEYTGNKGERFFSEWRSGQQRLPNGNTLIVESDAGRLLEVTPDRQIAWEYVNPTRGGEREQYVAVFTWAERIPRGALTFVGR